MRDDGAFCTPSARPRPKAPSAWVGATRWWFPAPGPACWKALTQEALADGILDATQPRRRELTLPQDEGRKRYIALQ